MTTDTTTPPVLVPPARAFVGPTPSSPYLYEAATREGRAAVGPGQDAGASESAATARGGMYLPDALATPTPHEG